MQGNPDIDVLMIPTNKAIKKHVKDRDAFTEIYNRAYEAVMISMEVKEAERDELQDKFETLELDYKDVCQKRLEAADSFSKQIIDLTNELVEARADAERLAKTSLYDDDFGDVQCVHCGYVEQINDEHSPDCPITLHRQLVAKYEVKECHE